MQHFEPKAGIRASAEDEPPLVDYRGGSGTGVQGETSGVMCVLSLSVIVLLIIGTIVQ